MIAKISEQFEKHRLFRRITYCTTFYLVWNLTIWSTELAYYLGTQGMSGFEIAATIAAIAAPPTLLVGFMTKLYTESRK